MALIWCDGFDHYGTTPNGGRDAMLAGAWAQFIGLGGQVVAVSDAQKRTGGYSLHFTGGTSTAAQVGARRLLGGDKPVAGVGFGLYLPAIPSNNGRNGFQLRDNANGDVLTFAFQSDASIEVFRGTASGTSIGRSGQVLTAQAWNHVEVRAHRHASAGSVEIRVNGVTVLDISDENTGANDFASVALGKITGSSVSWFEMYMDDIFTWDDSGSANNDFIGTKGVFWRPPNQDTAQADWMVSGAGTGWEALDEVPPDGDTSYIAADTVSDASEFDMADLPAGISEVAAVVAVGYMRKTDAGTGNVQMSLVSSAVGSPPAPAVANGADRPITEVYTYWQDVFENDPATGAPWEASAVNDVKLRFERTA